MPDEDRLNPAERELEAALRSLRPVPAQIDPVAAALAAGGRAARRRRRRWEAAAAAAVILAAGGAWLLLALGGRVPGGGERPSAAPRTHMVAVDQRSVPPLTWSAYRQALTRSPAELDALLDQQARSESAPDGQVRSLGRLTVLNTRFRSLSGEM
jgi:hypothetical protein